MKEGGLAANPLLRDYGSPPPETEATKPKVPLYDVEVVEKSARKDAEKERKSGGTAKPNRQGQIPFVQIPTRRSVEERNAPKKNQRVTIEEEDDEESPPPPRAASPPIPVVDRREPSYARKAPVENPETMENVGKELLDLEFPITLRALTSISPEAREYLRKLLTRRRVPKEEGAPKIPGEQRLMTYLESLHPSEEARYQSALKVLEDEDPVCEQNVLLRNPVFASDLPEVSCYVSSGDEYLPDGAFVVEDPVEVYFNSLDDEEARRPIVVSRESYPLTCIYPEINSSGIEEALLDGGSQICSMSEESARRLNISWDPTVQIYLQSANASTAKTLGLARNVLINISGISAYVQLHVVPKTAYKVLLGRPFDVLMCTTIHNKRNGEQLITVQDPNSERALTVPTFPRGRAPQNIKKRLEEERREYHFRDSRI